MSAACREFQLVSQVDLKGACLSAERSEVLSLSVTDSLSLRVSGIPSVSTIQDNLCSYFIPTLSDPALLCSQVGGPHTLYTV